MEKPYGVGLAMVDFKTPQGRIALMRWLKDLGIFAAVVGLAIAISTISASYGAQQQRVQQTLDDHEQRIKKIETLPEQVGAIRQRIEDIATYFAVPRKQK